MREALSENVGGGHHLKLFLTRVFFDQVEMSVCSRRSVNNLRLFQGMSPGFSCGREEGEQVEESASSSSLALSEVPGAERSVPETYRDLGTEAGSGNRTELQAPSAPFELGGRDRRSTLCDL